MVTADGGEYHCPSSYSLELVKCCFQLILSNAQSVRATSELVVSHLVQMHPLNLCMSPLIRFRCFHSAANRFSGLIVHEKIHLIDSYLLKVILEAVDRIYLNC